MKYKLIDQITSSRSAFLEVLVATIVLAISASGIASIIFEYFKESPTYLLLFLVVVMFLSIIVLAKKIGNARSHKLNIEGYINIDPTENELINVPRYDYGEDLFRYLKGAFKENPALRSQWDKEPLGSGFDIDIQNQTAKKKITGAAKLIKEATEYYVLDKLSTHLTDYFNQEKYSKSELREYSRKDVPDILLSNRFMELFTAPMENRASFDRGDLSSWPGAVVMSQGKNGAIYHRFDLTLPAKTVVSRDKSGAIKFNTENFILTFNVNFEEFGFVSPRGFESHYLGVKDFERSSEYQINVAFEVEFKLLSLLKNNKWDYHSWLDGFLNSLESKMSANVFFEQIQWSLAHTIIHCGEVSKRPNKTIQPTAKASAD